MNLTQRIVYWILLPFPFLFFIIVYVLIQKPEFDLINNPTFSVLEFNDKTNNGNSNVHISKKENALHIDFTLGDGYEYPYAGVQFNKKDYSFFSLEKYKFHFVINTKEDLRLSIRTNQFIEGFSDTSKPLSLVILMKSIVLKKGMNEFTIKASDINEIPDWWFQKNNQNAKSIQVESFDKTKSVWLFNSDAMVPINQTKEFEILEMKLQYDSMPFIYMYLMFALIYFIALLLFLWKVKKVNIKYIFMPIEMTKVKDKVPEAQSKILAFIGGNYHNPDLKLYDVAKDVGLTEDMTSELLKKYTNLSFRQYLNQIRMEEAKRLLKESSLQISEIAFKVGYNNVQHFNRVFKEYTNQQPKSFREQTSEK